MCRSQRCPPQPPKPAKKLNEDGEEEEPAEEEEEDKGTLPDILAEADTFRWVCGFKNEVMNMPLQLHFFYGRI